MASSHTNCLSLAGCLLATLTVTTAAETASPLMSNCFEDAERIAEVTPSDTINVRYASAAGGVKPCYAVRVVKEGRALTGFLIGAEFPAIARFEDDRRKYVPQLPPPPPAAAAASVAPKPAPEPEPPGPSSLAGLRGHDAAGNPVALDAIPAKNLVVYFWSASDKKSISAADAMEGIHAQFAAARKLEFVSVGAAKSIDQYRRAAEGAEATWPQIYDNEKLAERYKVNPARPILILDRARNVVSAVANPRDLIAQLQKLGSK